MDFHVFSRFFVVFRVFRIFSHFFALPVVFTNSHIFMKFQDFLTEMSTEMSVSLGGILFQYEHGIYKNTADLSRYQCILTKCWLPQNVWDTALFHMRKSAIPPSKMSIPYKIHGCCSKPSMVQRSF